MSLTAQQKTLITAQCNELEAKLNGANFNSKFSKFTLTLYFSESAPLIKIRKSTDVPYSDQIFIDTWFVDTNKSYFAEGNLDKNLHFDSIIKSFPQELNKLLKSNFNK